MVVRRTSYVVGHTARLISRVLGLWPAATPRALPLRGTGPLLPTGIDGRTGGEGLSVRIVTW